MRASAVGRSLVPVCCSTLADTTSIGVSELLSVRSLARVPVTITALKSFVLAGAEAEVVASCAAAVLVNATSTAAGSQARMGGA
jgi:hypothetical protein